MHRRLRSSRYLHDRSDCYRLERQLPGGPISHREIAPFHGAHTVELEIGKAPRPSGAGMGKAQKLTPEMRAHLGQYDCIDIQ